LQKLPLRRKAKLSERLGLLACCWPRLEHLRDFTGRSEGQKVGGRQERIFQFGDRIEKYSSGAEDESAKRGRQREPKILGLLPFCPSCEKISIAEGGLEPLQQLLRFRLQFGSPRCPLLKSRWHERSCRHWPLLTNIFRERRGFHLPAEGHFPRGLAATSHDDRREKMANIGQRWGEVSRSRRTSLSEVGRAAT
jgi:hypothetical protein